MRVIEEVGAEMKAIAIVGASGVRGRRDGNALVGRDRGAGELADQPAISYFVVEHNRIAVAITLADTAEARPDRADGCWPEDRGPRGLIKDLITFVHDLNVLSCPDGAVGIGRRAIANDTWKWDTIKIEDGGGHRFRKQSSQQAVVDNRVRG